jgi:hypothetical protein
MYDDCEEVSLTALRTILEVKIVVWKMSGEEFSNRREEKEGKVTLVFGGASLKFLLWSSGCV